MKKAFFITSALLSITVVSFIGYKSFKYFHSQKQNKANVETLSTNLYKNVASNNESTKTNSQATKKNTTDSSDNKAAPAQKDMDNKKYFKVKPEKETGSENLTNNIISKNNKDFLITPTYDKSGQSTHPDMVYFKDGFNNFKYWMAYTPYPFFNDRFENPCILASNDGTNFVVPKGLTNPLVPEPEDFRQGGHLSDTDMMFHDKKLIMHYVYNKKGTYGPSKIFRIKSSDGINWTNPELVFSTDKNTSAYSPAIIQENQTTNMWYVGGEGVMFHTYSPDGEKTWQKPLRCKINNGKWLVWHIDVIKTKDKSGQNMYEGLACSRSVELNKRAVFYMRSYDGLRWDFSKQPLIYPSENGWDNLHIYRSTMIKEDSRYKIWYSACDKKNVWHIGTTEFSEEEINSLDMDTVTLNDPDKPNANL